MLLPVEDFSVRIFPNDEMLTGFVPVLLDAPGYDFFQINPFVVFTTPGSHQAHP